MKNFTQFYKNIFGVIICIFFVNSSYAQTPSYHTQPTANVGLRFPWGVTGSQSGERIQSVYLPNDFVTSAPPRGFITSVWFRGYAGSTSFNGPTTLGNLTVKLATTTQTIASTSGWITSGLTQVYGPKSTAINFQGTWFELVLDQPFYYDGTSNLVVDVFNNQGTVTTRYGEMESSSLPRIVYGTNNSPTSTYNYLFNFGLEIFPGYPCTDTPKSSISWPKRVCPNKGFDIGPDSFYADAQYVWEVSTNGFQWSKFTGSVGQYGEIRDSITNPKYYRVTITCDSNKNFKWTTPIHKVEVAPFYYCYCDNYVASDNGTDIGNIRLVNLTSYDTSLNNGNGMPLYNNNKANRQYTTYRDSISWPCLYRDTTYKALITQIHEKSTFTKTWMQAYIDYNHDGLYNPVTEKVFVKELDGLTNPKEVLEVDFTVPSTAKIGPTGMRVIISDTALTAEPCDSVSGGGEVEDYIVKICYRPCDGPVNAGLVVSTDTTMCSDYAYTLTDTTYEKARSAFDRSWQISGDNITWFNISGSKDKDTLMRTFGGQPLYYRVRAVCPPTGDTTFSDARLIDVKPGYKCYCYSRAEGGISYDSSDIGGVTFGGINQYNGGPHLLNPTAVLPRTDYTDLAPAVMYVDSFYKFYVYHTQKTAIHGDAKITVFMDFNNNKLYDIPDERIYTGYTAIGNHTLIDSVQIPRTVIPDVPTGVRVILNNDLAPNVPSDSACGPYVSGETEDFIVIFRKAFPESVNGVSKLNGFGIHPNPTAGRFTVRFSAAGEVDKVAVRVMSVTGQVVATEEYEVGGTEFSRELNLEGQPAGVYFVELTTDGQKLVRKLIVQ